MSDTRPDVLVVGGGVIGCFAARHLAARGCAVTLIERDRVGSGASLGNCGYVCPSHVHPLCGPGAVLSGLRTMATFGGALSIPPRWDPPLWRWLARFARHCNERDFWHASIARHALLAASRDEYQQIADQDGRRIGWSDRGLLTVYRSRRDFEAFEATAEQLRERFGVRVDGFPGDELCRLAPELRTGLAGGWHFPADAHLSPGRLLQLLRASLIDAGVIIREHSQVAELRLEAGRVIAVRIQPGDWIEAEQVVIAAGAETAHFAKPLGCDLPIIPGKGFSVTFENTDSMPNLPMIFEDDHVAITHFGDSFRVGSTMQLTGFSRSVPESRIRLLKRAAERHLRAPLPAGTEHAWAGWRPMVPDGLPLIGRTPVAANCFIAGGNGMIGIATAPATGRLVAELVTGDQPHLDPSPYRPERFGRHGVAAA